MSWTAIRNAMQSAITAASGLSSGQVIWSFQNNPEPALSYISMKLTPMTTIGLDWVKKTTVSAWLPTHVYTTGMNVLNDSGKRYVCTMGGTSAASGGPTGISGNVVDGTVIWAFGGTSQEIIAQVSGMREVTLELTCFTDATATEADASILAETTSTSMLLPSIRTGLQAANIGLFDPGPVSYVPQVVAVKFRGRAVVPLRCYVPAQSVIEYITYIQTVSGTLSVSDAKSGGPMDVPFRAGG